MSITVTQKKGLIQTFLFVVLLLLSGVGITKIKAVLTEKSSPPKKKTQFTNTVNHWHKFRGDVRNTGFAPGTRGPEKPRLLWKVKMENEVMSSPVVDVQGRVFIGSHDSRVYVISPAGRVLVSFATGQGVLSSVLLQDGRIWFGGMDGRIYKGRVMIDQKGLPCMMVEYYKELGDWLVSSPAPMGDRTLVACRDGYLYAIQQFTGKVLWQTFIGSQRYEVQSSPAVVGDRLFIGSGRGRIYCIDREGRMVWDFITAGPVFASVGVDEQGKIYVGDRKGVFYCLYADGRLRWQYDGGSPITSSTCLSTDNQVIFCTTGGLIVSLDRSTGSLKWTYDANSPIESSPACDGDGNLYVGTDAGVLLSLDSRGNFRWKYKTGGPILSSPAIDKKGRIIFGCEDRNVYCLGDSAIR